MTLYELTGEYQRLMYRYEIAETDEEAEAIWAEMDNMAGDIGMKADAYARVMRNKIAEAEAYQKEADRLEELAKRQQKTADRLKESIRQAMVQLGAKEIPTTIGIWKTRTNAPSCDVEKIEDVPEQFRKPLPPPKVPYTVDKDAAKKWWKDNGQQAIPGLHIERKVSVSFK